MIFSSFRVLPFLLPLLVLACGGPERDGPAVAEPVSGVGSGVESSPELLHILIPTATPWPTFTPVPTVIPTPSPAPTRPPAPTATPWPRFSLEPENSTDGVGKPSWVPDGSELERNYVFLEKQALLPFWGGELPDYLVERDWDRMPSPSPVVSSDTRYMLWVVAFDFTQASPDYEVPGLIRWRSVPVGIDPVIMFEVPVTVSAGIPFFYHGLGRDDPGLWLPGFYRVEFLDGLREVVAYAEFEVRR